MEKTYPLHDGDRGDHPSAASSGADERRNDDGGEHKQDRYSLALLLFIFYFK